MLTNLLFILIIASGSVYAASKYDRRFEETMPVFAMGMVLLLFVFGLLGVLNLGMGVIYAMALGFYLLTAWELLKNKKARCFLQNLITPASVFFAAMCVAFSVWNFGKRASGVDEFTHWVDIVKVVTSIDDFGTNPAANSTFQSYPPAMMLFQYAIQKVYLLAKPDALFSEWRVYFGYQVFILTVMLPFFRNTSFRQPLRLLLNAAITLLAPLLFYGDLYGSAYIDPFVGILYGAGMAMVLLRPKRDKLYIAYICLLCAILTLSKDVGLAFSLIIALAYILVRILENADVKAGICHRESMAVLLAAYLPKLLWNWEISASGAKKIFDGKIDWGVLIHVLLHRDDSYRSQVMRLYQDALYEESLRLVNFSLKINYMSLLLLSVAAIYGVYLLYKNKYPEHQKSTGAVMICSAVALVGYVMGMCVMYMFKFSEYEALQLASMTRYLNIVFLGTWMCLLLLLANWVYQRHCSRELSFFLLVAVLVCSPTKQFSDFMQGDYVEESVWVRAPYETLSEAIQEHCDGNQRIYFISQESNGFDYWVTRFNARPNGFSGFTWSIGEPFYEGDIWTQNITLDEWRATLLEQYDYVAIYRINDYFLEHFGPLFEDSDEIEDNTLYRINKETGMLQKCDAK